MAEQQTAQQTAAVTDLASYQQFALDQQAANNAWSAQQAEKQMAFQREMSDTAHQREVKDLQAAGLNPILSVNSGASVPNGAAGEADTSASGNVGAILQQVLQAQSAREVAGMYNAATLAAASIAANASMYGADMSYQNAEDHPKTLEEVGARQLLATGKQVDKQLTNGYSSILNGIKGAISTAAQKAAQSPRVKAAAHRYAWNVQTMKSLGLDPMLMSRLASTYSKKQVLELMNDPNRIRILQSYSNFFTQNSSHRTPSWIQKIGRALGL